MEVYGKNRKCKVKHRAWFDDFEEGLPWELTMVGRMEVGPYQDPKKIKVGKAGARHGLPSTSPSI